MKKTAFILFTFLGLMGACTNTGKTSGQQGGDQDSTQQANLYQCPMDCEKGKTYEKPGTCPVCEMDLEQKK